MNDKAQRATTTAKLAATATCTSALVAILTFATGQCPSRNAPTEQRPPEKVPATEPPPVSPEPDPASPPPPTGAPVVSPETPTKTGRTRRPVPRRPVPTPVLLTESTPLTLPQLDDRLIRLRCEDIDAVSYAVVYGLGKPLPILRAVDITLPDRSGHQVHLSLSRRSDHPCSVHVHTSK